MEEQILHCKRFTQFKNAYVEGVSENTFIFVLKPFVPMHAGSSGPTEQGVVGYQIELLATEIQQITHS